MKKALLLCTSCNYNSVGGAQTVVSRGDTVVLQARMTSTGTQDVTFTYIAWMVE